ncbi:MAG: Asp23/Gls24 family envelope stress response protein [Lachnospiraceae bacterium]|jgi:uncharacterized alkaline shock family protein YloU|nr:Asp23/Gls24 family envelope stress response protein [Lachnospiraceae bacterium]
MSEKRIGRVRLADDVVPVIASIAASEVEGVVSVADNMTSEILSKMGMRKAPKGVKVSIENKKVAVDMALGIDAGINVPETSRKVQEKVKEAIEEMIGLEVVDVNIRIASVLLPKGE